MNDRMETDVIVVGAGPTGLTLAHELARGGIRCHLIDKDNGPSVHSKALAVQARSLELFRWMQLDRQFLDQGFRAPGIRISVEGKYVAKGELSGLLDAGTRAGFVLVISQADTEKILIAGLARHGGCVHWQTECLRFVRTGADLFPVVATCRRANGTTYEIAARFIVGCDGAHSMVRHAMPVEFAGDAYQQRFILADAKLTWSHSYDYLNLFLNQDGCLYLFSFSRAAVWPPDPDGPEGGTGQGSGAGPDQSLSRGIHHGSGSADSSGVDFPVPAPSSGCDLIQ